MKTVNRILPLLLILPAALAANPDDAASLWEAEQGSNLLLGAEFPAEIIAGEQFTATLQFAEPITEVRYQICEIGQVCWVSNIPTNAIGNDWQLNTADIPTHQPDVRSEPIQFEEGMRVGVQYFVTIGNETVNFPHGEECDLYAPDEEWLACQETHYFGINVIAGEQETPPLALPMLALALLAFAVMRRA